MLRITPWERSALELLAHGSTVDELSGRLGVGHAEIDARLSALLRKMGAATPSEAIHAATRRGLVTTPADRGRGASQV